MEEKELHAQIHAEWKEKASSLAESAKRKVQHNPKKAKQLAAGLLVLLVFLGVTGFVNGANKTEDFSVQSTLEMDETNINTQIAGAIETVAVEKGDTVRKGELIATVNSDTLLTQRAQAQAAVDTIVGQITAAQATKNGAAANYQSVVNGADAETIAQAKASYDLAATTYQSKKELYEQGAISKIEFDSAETTYEITKQQYGLVKKGTSSEDRSAAASQVAAAGGSVEALQGQLNQAKAALAEIDTYIEKTKITAPTDGVVTQMNVEAGELVSTGLPIAVITATAKPSIQCNVMEDQLRNVKEGQSVELTFPAYPGETFKGRVESINKSADFAVKRATNSNGEYDVVAFGVKVVPLNVLEPLYAGMTVTVDFSANAGAID